MVAECLGQAALTFVEPIATLLLVLDHHADISLSNPSRSSGKRLQSPSEKQQHGNGLIFSL